MTKTKLFKRSVYLFAAAAILFSACRKKDAVLADNFVVFEVSAQGIAAADTAITVKIKTQSSVGTAIPVVLNVTEQGVAYTTQYTTVPAVETGKINLTIPSGNNEASFTIKKTTGASFDGTEKIVFDIFSSGSPVLIGTTKQFTLSFGELLATSSTAVVEGGGPTYPNKVFIDLSANRQTGAERTSWDLGFYCGGDDFRVTLNSSVNMMVKQLVANDLAAVTAADTIGLTTDVAFSQAAPAVTQLPYIDYPNGDLARTAIAQISATAGDNKVYIVNRGNGIGTGAASRGWKKIRVIRNAAGGYTLQHADIAATTFTSVDIAKDDAYFFKHVSFETGAATVEPQKGKWDIAWTYFANVTNFGGGEVPYMFQDIIVLNRSVQVAKVMVTTKEFAAFGEADIAAQTFLPAQNAIASDWRSGGGPTTSPAVRTDRYYIIKDADNNYYKLRFTGLTQNSERGYPSYESVLVKQG